MPNAAYYDDPNLGSQVPSPDQANPDAQATNATTTGTIDQLIKSRPAVQAWFSAHQGGRNLSASDKQQLFALLRQQGVGTDALEVDDDGTFRANDPHNTATILKGLALAFGPLAVGATIPALAGSAAPAVTGSTAAQAGGSLAAASTAPAVGSLATGAAASGAVPAALAAGGTTAATYGPAAAIGGGLTATDALRYGAPVAANLVSGLIQANATGKASDAQQKYLEEALAYEKEKDAYDRTTAANKVQLEANRYASYSGNIAPYLANGASSGNRMTSLLGLPAGAPNAGGSLATRGTSAPAGNPLDYADTLSAADKAKVDALLKKHNSSDNPAYWYGVNAMHGGFDATGADWNDQRISTGDGAGKGYAAIAAPNAAPPAQQTTQPLARTMDTSVMLKAPDGSTKQVPASQLSYWIGKGAQQVSA